MLVSPAHPAADVLRGIDIEWNIDYQFDWELRHLSGPFLEAEYHEHMIIYARVRGSATE
jgi:hypothetical protein